MQKVKVSANPSAEGDYITAKVTYMPEFWSDGQTLTGVQREHGTGERAMVKKPVAITMPDGIHTIDHNAFRTWGSLQSICFQHTPYQMGSGVFSDCTALESVTFAEGMEKIPLDTFSGCNKLRSVHLPSTIKRINMDAFKNCYGLKEITFPISLETIELYAFWGCRALEEIRFPESVTELGDDCFASCTGLKKVYLPDSLQSIGSCTFMNCISLEEIVIPSGITKLPLGVFAGCRNLKRVVLPDTLEYVDPYAFYKCDKLEQVEHPAVERFANALEHTPFWRNLHPDAPYQPQVPMELLNKIAGEVSGAMLSAMGYHWFEVDREYRIFLTDQPGVIEVHSRYQEVPQTGEFFNDCWLMSEQLEPLSGIQPLIRQTDTEIRQSRDFWETQLELAATAVNLQAERNVR